MSNPTEIAVQQAHLIEKIRILDWAVEEAEKATDLDELRKVLKAAYKDTVKLLNAPLAIK